MFPPDVVTFDAGQTLVELDLDFLVGRLAERGIAARPDTLAAAAPAAWRRYDAVVAEGGSQAWHAFMTGLLAGSGIGQAAALADWLWREQPRANLWRRPIPDMVALARELKAAGARVAVLSNSEGKLAELLAEIGIADAFDAVVDSGREGIEKPDPRIFARTLERLAAPAARAVHVGDSWAADVEGALAAGWRAIWYRSRPSAIGGDDPRVAIAGSASEVRAALRALA
ncbi:MAG: HAD family hydrolase [Acidobacteriota bacterium]